MLNVGQRIKVKAQDLDYQGQGVCKVDNYVVFVKGLLKDEVALIEIYETKKHFANGHIVEIQSKSAHRVDHKASKYNSCDLIHLSRDEQIEWQRKTTIETFKKIAKKDVDLTSSIVGKKDTHYRNKAVFHVMDKPTLTLGMYDIGNQKLIEVDDFELAQESIRKAIKHMHEKPIKIDYKVLKHIAFRTNQSQELLITMIATDSHFLGIEALLEHIKAIPNVVGITLNIKKNPRHIFGDTSFTLYGINEITEQFNGLSIYMDDRSFFQINYEVMLETYACIAQYIKKDDQIIDAYCGVGGIGFYLHDRVASVVMIDQNEQSIKNAMKTKLIHQLSHVDIVLSDVKDYKPEFDDMTMIVDPPRSGLDSMFIERLKKMNLKKIIYLSCDVKTLVRDIDMLSDCFQLEALHTISMFPHTTSVETLAYLKIKT